MVRKERNWVGIVETRCSNCDDKGKVALQTVGTYKRLNAGDTLDFACRVCGRSSMRVVTARGGPEAQREALLFLVERKSRIEKNARDFLSMLYTDASPSQRVWLEKVKEKFMNVPESESRRSGSGQGSRSRGGASGRRSPKGTASRRGS